MLTLPSMGVFPTPRYIIASCVFAWKTNNFVILFRTCFEDYISTVPLRLTMSPSIILKLLPKSIKEGLCVAFLLTITIINQCLEGEQLELISKSGYPPRCFSLDLKWNSNLAILILAWACRVSLNNQNLHSIQQPTWDTSQEYDCVSNHDSYLTIPKS